MQGVSASAPSSPPQGVHGVQGVQGVSASAPSSPPHGVQGVQGVHGVAAVGPQGLQGVAAPPLIIDAMTGMSPNMRPPMTRPYTTPFMVGLNRCTGAKNLA